MTTPAARLGARVLVISALAPYSVPAVSETGIGIAADELESVFQEFHQTEQSSRTEGLGLGLSIVQRTADLLECQVGVESESGEGSSFYVDVPISEGGVQHPEEDRETEPIASSGGARTHR